MKIPKSIRRDLTLAKMLLEGVEESLDALSGDLYKEDLAVSVYNCLVSAEENVAAIKKEFKKVMEVKSNENP